MLVLGIAGAATLRRSFLRAYIKRTPSLVFLLSFLTSAQEKLQDHVYSIFFDVLCRFFIVTIRIF